jgi:hypothetical protein
MDHPYYLSSDPLANEVKFAPHCCCNFARLSMITLNVQNVSAHVNHELELAGAVEARGPLGGMRRADASAILAATILVRA